MNTFILLDGSLFLLIGLIVLVFPSPQPALTRPVSTDDLLPISQTRQLLAAMFISSGMLLIVIGRHVTDLATLQGIGYARIIAFALVICLNALQFRSRRWKSAPLVALMSLFSAMSLVYAYLMLADKLN